MLERRRVAAGKEAPLPVVHYPATRQGLDQLLQRLTRSLQARRQGRKAEELAYDAMLSDEGRGMLYVPFLNYADGNLDATREMLCGPRSVPGLSDGGAHCTSIAA